MDTLQQLQRRLDGVRGTPAEPPTSTNSAVLPRPRPPTPPRGIPLPKPRARAQVQAAPRRAPSSSLASFESYLLSPSFEPSSTGGGSATAQLTPATTAPNVHLNRHGSILINSGAGRGREREAPRVHVTRRGDVYVEKRSRSPSPVLDAVVRKQQQLRRRRPASPPRTPVRPISARQVALDPVLRQRANVLTPVAAALQRKWERSQRRPMSF